MRKPLITAVFIALFTSGCDLSSKHWAILSTAAGPRSVIPGALDLVHRENPGMAFSLMIDWPATVRMAILGTAAAIAITIGFYVVATKPMRRSAIIAIGLIAGGALGNLIDRIHSGTVTDFLHVHRGAFDWPAFNVADIAVTCGAILFALSKPVAHPS